MGRKQNVHRTTINGFSILDEVWMMKIFECCIYHCNPGSGVLDEGDGWGSVTAPAIVLRDGLAPPRRRARLLPLLEDPATMYTYQPSASRQWMVHTYLEYRILS